MVVVVLWRPAKKEKIQVKVMPPILPTSLDTWIDTCAARYRVPAKVIRYVATMESGMGQSHLAKRNNNLFGIRKKHAWAKYESRFESVEDFCRFIHRHYPKQVGKNTGVFTLWGYREKGKHWKIELNS